MEIVLDNNPEMTQPLPYLRGQFHLWQYKIPYFMAAVPWEVARTRFTLIDELPSSAREEWSLSELFQRDIDWERIRTELVKYLKSETQPQFFNALTLALLPRVGDTFGADYKPQVCPAMENPTLEPPIQVGGVQMQAFKNTQGRLGQIRWDVKTTVAVAVDGQHRLAAIKQLGNLADAAKRESSSIPVLFLVPDPAAGLLLPPQPADVKPIQATLRRLFIDLNKHARDIPQAREILLDDQDVHRVCVRRLVASKLSATGEPNRLPLGLVDWLSEENKIDRGPFLTTVLLLEALTFEVLGKRVAHGDFDYTEEGLDEVEQEIAKIQEWLLRSFSPDQANLDLLMAQVRRCFDQQVALSWTPEHLAYLADRFEHLWVPHLYRLFREIRPYRRVWDLCDTKKLLAPEMVNLYAAKYIAEGDRADQRAAEIQDEVARTRPEWSYSSDFVQPLATIDSEFKDGNWAFTVVFQKAMFRSFSSLLQQYPEFVGGGANPRDRFTSKWIKAANALLDTNLAPVEATFGRPTQLFWAGIGLKPEGRIDFGNAGCERLSRWISAWVCMKSLESIPTFGSLEQASDGIEIILRNLLRKAVVVRGFKDLARAQLPANASAERIETVATEHIAKRYELLRSLVQG